MDPMDEAVRLSLEMMEAGHGGPFGAVVVKDGAIIARGYNRVTSTNDPTAHAEVVAIREACRVLGSFQLIGCEVYSSCEPCPMCLAALYWARPLRVYFACTREDAARIGFDDQVIYDEIARPIAERTLELVQVDHPGSLQAMKRWSEKLDRVKY
jgi:tRNA(Arg) A34 adenosine deaminase TadA